ncbi:hypothetical protein A1D25_05815 [Ursidibacter arcticus]|uniref:hypothetical protein n=1 Tax=Ursidibacter arcticus TaxID=1524965 RepID=UPI0012F7BDC5|nr:hypothetical protein [Ursidibacter arcticus]KAE9535120.1 hypothetical protein A1D25_05815 [Ursidibacter arcticus]
MNVTFKISALALFVAITATGCTGPNGSSSDVKAPTQVTPNTQTTPNASGVTTSQSSSSTTTPTPPPPPPAKIISLDSAGKKWRVVNNKNSASHVIGSDISYRVSRAYLGFVKNGTILNRKHNTSSDCTNNHCKGDVLQNDTAINKTQRYYLDELAQENGKPLLGTYSGSIEKPFAGKVVDVSFDNDDKLTITKTDATKINYLFTNQPYSSYGALFTNNNDIESFALVQSAGEQGGNEEFEVYKRQLHQGQNTGRIVWNENVAGDATYKGNVIAVTHTYHPGKFDSLPSLPQEDGTITLKAHFGETWEKTTVSGTLDSKTIGQIDLPQASLSSNTISAQRVDISHNINNSGKKFQGEYDVYFGGKDLSDAVGGINLQNHEDISQLNDGEVRKYSAVFGATKQPK